MREYTPTTGVVRDIYRTHLGQSIQAERNAEFDRWLAAHDAQVSAQGFRDGVNFIDNDPSKSWGGAMVAGRSEAARRMNAIATQDGAS